MKERLKSYSIVAVTLALLYIVLQQVGLVTLIETLRRAEPFWLCLSLGVSPFLVLVSVVRWQGLLISQGILVALPRLCALYLVGRFFNNFLPSSIGGDLIRGYELSKVTKNGPEAVASIFMDRFTGFVVLVLFAAGAALTHLGVALDTGLMPAIVTAVIALVSVIWLVLDSRPLVWVSRWTRFPWGQKYVAKLWSFHESVLAYRRRPRAVAIALGWSVVFMLLAIANVYTSGKAFDGSISVWDVTAIVPIVMLVAMLPLTINGLGLQELAYVLLFPAFGVPASVGLAAILLIRGKEAVLSIAGAILYPTIRASVRAGINAGVGADGRVPKRAQGAEAHIETSRERTTACSGR